MNKTIRKMLVLLLLVSAVAGALTACGKKKEDIASKKTLIVGFDAEFPPYGYMDEETEEYIGFDLSLAEEVCNRKGWTLKKQPIEWEAKDMELNSGAIDCIWNGFTINGREGLYTWSKAYIDNSQVVIVKSNSNIKKLSDLEGKIVVVQKDSSALAAFTGEDATDENRELAAKFKDLQQVGDYNSAFMDLEAGVVNAICMDIGVAKYQLDQRGSKFMMLTENVSSEQYGIGFKQGNTELRDAVQEVLDEMLEDGTFAKIAQEWGLSDCICLGQPGTDSAYLQEEGAKKESFKDMFVDVVDKLAEGMLASLAIFFLTLIFAIPLGLILCAIRKSKLKVVRWIASIYISIMRGTPLMLQLLVVFFGPYYVFGMQVSSSYRFYAVIIGFSLNYAAYFAEIFRAGVESIPKGQFEAASVLGYSKIQTFTKVVFIQMIKNVLPPMTNEVITLVKDTSLAFALAYTEMFTLAKQVAAAKASIMPIFIAGLFYYIFNSLVAFIMSRVEKKMQYFR